MADLAKLIKDKSPTVKVLLTLNGEPLMNDAVGDDDPTQMSITYNSPMSKAYREVEFDLQDDAIESLKENGQDVTIDSRKVFEIRVNKLSHNAVEWDITLDGKPKLTQEAVTDLLTNYPMFLYQSEDAMNKEAGFILS